MIFSYFHDYFPHLPTYHWLLMAAISLILSLILLKHNNRSVFGYIALCFTIMVGLFLLDALVLNRMDNKRHQFSGLNLDAELIRLIHGTKDNRMSMVFNVIAFVPFGLFLSLFLIEINRVSFKRCLFFVASITFGLSLCIETLQVVFRIGFFELTDLILNTSGSVIGALLTLIVGNMMRAFQNANRF